MLPTMEQAQALLAEAEGCNPGPWGDHSRTVAMCARRIAEKCGMDAGKAYIVGLLHDIGRRFGRGHLQHVYDGWQYMLSLGYDEAAKVCLTHSFNLQVLSDYIGRHDVTPQQETELAGALAKVQYDDYDLLIQLCDAIGGAGEVLGLAARMTDVKNRYGAYPQRKWERNFELKRYFSEKCGADIEEMLRA